MNLTTSYQYIGSSPENGPIISSNSGYYSRFYVRAKVKSYNTSNATLTAEVLIRNNWMGWRSYNTVIKLTGADSHVFVNSGSSGRWDGAYGGGSGSGSSSYATLWSATWDFDVDYGTFDLGAQISGSAINTCSPSASCTVIKPTITLTYNANGGTGAPAAQTIDRNTTSTLSSTIPSKADSISGTRTVTFNTGSGTIIGPSTATSSGTTTYSFKEWYTTQGGTGGTAYNPGDPITVGTSDIILYAQWNPSATTWNKITLPGAFRPGYILLGWSETSGSSTITSGMTVGAQYLPSATKTIYAVWQQQNVNLKICQELYDLFYPVGSIYMTMVNINPSQLFGGTWVRIGVGRTLISAGGGTNPVGDANTVNTWGSWDSTGQTSLFPAGERGGETTHTLTESELPEIDSGSISWHGQEHGTHIYNLNPGTGGTTRWYGTKVSGQYQTTGATSGAYSYSFVGFKFGGGGSHRNVEPYLAVYMWQRTA